jgi:hypothetical protein
MKSPGCGMPRTRSRLVSASRRTSPVYRDLSSSAPGGAIERINAPRPEASLTCACGKASEQERTRHVATEQGLPAFSPEPVGVRGQTTVRVDPDVERACTRKFGAWPWANLGAAADEGSIGPGGGCAGPAAPQRPLTRTSSFFRAPSTASPATTRRTWASTRARSPSSRSALPTRRISSSGIGFAGKPMNLPRFKERASKLPLYTFRRLDATGDPTGATLQLTAPRGLITGSSFEFARSGRGPARPDGAGGSSSKTALP